MFEKEGELSKFASLSLFGPYSNPYLPESETFSKSRPCPKGPVRFIVAADSGRDDLPVGVLGRQFLLELVDLTGKVILEAFLEKFDIVPVIYFYLALFDIF